MRGPVSATGVVSSLAIPESVLVQGEWHGPRRVHVEAIA